MKVPLADLQSQYRKYQPEIDSAIKSVLDTSQYILGKAVAGFEQAFASAHRTKHCVAVGSGTDALHVALWAAGIGPGMSVVTTPFTFIATVEAISLTGATPVFVDIDPRTYTMDPVKLEAVLAAGPGAGKPPVRAILPVHLYGQTADMDALTAIAKKYNVIIIEDACQSHMAKWDNVFVGNFGAAAGFSFYPGKNLGAYGEAGGVLLNDDALAKKVRQLRDHGQSEKYKHEYEGHNYRMDGIQGAVLGAKMKHLDEWTIRRRAIAKTYITLLSGVGDLVLPYEAPKAYHVFHVFAMRTRKRAELQEFLAKKEVATALHYPIPLHLQQAYGHLGYPEGAFPVSEIVAREIISLPLYPELTDDQVQFVVDSVKEFYSK
jgi:dTDP-4-amino-4,6-dideoxygalactose transaminase